MKKLNIKITYLYHSGFTVETDQCLLIFDFYQGTIRLPDKKTYVFVSHNHADHYNPEIFAWRKDRADIRYILSDDIRGDAAVPPETDQIIFISPYEEKQLEDLKVKAYASTDEGVSFLVQYDGNNIFHAGDLNWWHWPDDTPEGKLMAENGFQEALAAMKRERIDIAFFPVDPRLEENYDQGAELFIQVMHPAYFIPMHFWDEHEMVRQFKDKMETSSTKVVQFSQRGQEAILQD